MDTFPSKEKFGTQMSGGNGWGKNGSLYGKEKGVLAGDGRLMCLVYVFCDYPLFFTKMEVILREG